MTYTVKKDCGWKDFAAQAGAEIAHADLKTGDGKPLPPEVVADLLRRKAMVPVPPADAQAKPHKGKAKASPPTPTPEGDDAPKGA